MTLSFKETETVLNYYPLQMQKAKKFSLLLKKHFLQKRNEEQNNSFNSQGNPVILDKKSKCLGGPVGTIYQNKRHFSFRKKTGKILILVMIILIL